VVGPEDLLPPDARALAEVLVDGWLSQFHAADFWRADGAAVLGAIVSDARGTLTAAGVIPDDETLCNLFQLITLCYAGAAAEVHGELEGSVQAVNPGAHPSRDGRRHGVCTLHD
jgi:hypothetical protein